MAHERLRPQYFFDQDRIDQLKQIAPECFEDGKINFETLRQNLGDWTQNEEDPELEHFGIFWPGKREARRAAALPPQGALEPVWGDGLKADGTPDIDGENDSKNIFIEGENLEVLKLLQKSYANKIKMIYIDPPYNTGKDFIYDDNFTEPIQEYLKRTGQLDSDNKPWTTNKKSDGRFHSKWLSMIYPRIKLAKNLLTHDGVIFVSIDDHEYNNLKSIMDEIFGAENFIANFIWNTDGHTDNQLEVKINHEYILAYKRNQNASVFNHIIDPNTRKESNLHKGFAENSITKNGHANPPSRVLLKKGFPCIVEELDLPKSKIDQNYFDEVDRIGHINREITKKYFATYPIRLNDIKVRNGILQNDVEVYSGWANVNKLKEFIDKGFKPILESDGNITFYLSSKGVIYYKKERDGAKNILSVLKNFMTTEKMRSILENNEIYFSYPKPVDLIQYLISMGLRENEIVLDFFAGSGSTGHAFYNHIAKSGIEAKYILVQMYELTNENSIAYQKGFKSIPEITLKRLKHFSNTNNIVNNSLGFKYYKYSYSNYTIWRNYEGTTVHDLEMQLNDYTKNPVRENYSKDGLVTELILLEGFTLCSNIVVVSEINSNTVKKVFNDYCDHSLLICLDSEIKKETIGDLQISGADIFICFDSAISLEDKLRLSDRGMIKTI